MSEHLTLLARSNTGMSTGYASNANPATAILSDGSFFLAINSDNINNAPLYGGVVTMWQLDSDLNVLGSAVLT